MLALLCAAALRLVGTFPIPQMTGTFDHLAGDERGGRLFLSAQDEHAVYVLDVESGKVLRRLSGMFNRPQGEYFIPELARLVTSNGRDGTVRFTDTDSFEVVGSAQLSIGADLMAYDSPRKRLYIESGGRDSNRGEGKISIVDATSGKVLGEIATGYRAAAMAMEKARPRLYVALPALRQVLLVDTERNEITGAYPVHGRPAFLGLDERHHRLFVPTRSHPSFPADPMVEVVDTESGRRVAALPTADESEGVAWDAARCRIYLTGLAGQVHAIAQLDPDRYETLARIETGPHAGTSFWMPARDRLFVAVPPHDGRPAEVIAFAPSEGPTCR